MDVLYASYVNRETYIEAKVATCSPCFFVSHFNGFCVCVLQVYLLCE